MKKLFLICFALLNVFCSSLFAQQSEPMTLLIKAENNTAFYGTDFSGQYTIIQDKPGEGRNVTYATMYRRDSANKWTILITGPDSEKGKGYLQFDSNIWFYDPKDRTFTFTSARDKFQNTNANTSDFAPQKYSQKYSIESCEAVKLGAFNCSKMVLKAKTNNVEYPEIRLWISNDDGLIRKREDYSLSGQKLRTLAMPGYQKVQVGDKNYFIPSNMVIQDNLKGKKINNKMEYEKTLITIENPGFSKVEDSVYTKPYLEMIGAR